MDDPISYNKKSRLLKVFVTKGRIIKFYDVWTSQSKLIYENMTTARECVSNHMTQSWDKNTANLCQKVWEIPASDFSSAKPTRQ